ncbi:hypothetical protein K432DRAFT_411141 [Lepidopterella palustris CBS 459.81]|uniref:Uncharacterized protein n=1 Tax=Lepidopterella palustris CBS 459.81 TaxID=1314670 RepID=A0A8E2DWE4_9PEZI|nr:hypothetical protein K432DRAFT_411141 [Lepidopterella palustris CBS 459.81]
MPPTREKGLRIDAVLSNYTQPNTGAAIPGILAKGTYKGKDFPSALDEGGTAPLRKSKSANIADQLTLLDFLF